MIGFNKSVCGASHIRKDMVCQDHSEVRQIGEGDSSIWLAAVADGHGDETCFRSHRGAKLAVQSALENMSLFLEQSVQTEGGALSFLEDDEENTVKRLTDSILYSWTSMVSVDRQEDPFTEEELQKAGQYLERYEKGQDLAHPYGTTLIAAMATEEYLLMIHQGDGRCILFWEDGSCEEPVPWDEECVFNSTTSMCDKSASKRIRHRFISLNGRRPMAVFLASDGVEDAYPEIQGAYSFFRVLMAEHMADTELPVLESYLEGFLPGFSEQGSGDDISIAGIYDPELVSKMQGKLQEDAASYRKGYRIRELEGRMISMERKDRILKERAEKETDSELMEFRNKEYAEYHKEFEEVLAELSELKAAGTEDRKE